jgi:hypothetical protein
MIQTSSPAGFGHCFFVLFGFVSDFGFRISDFGFVSVLRYNDLPWRSPPPTR